MTESETRATVRRGLNDLKPFLAAYVAQHAGVPSVQDQDVSGLLKILLLEWDAKFRNKLPPVARSYVFELKDVRNRWAHEASFTKAEAERALDTMRQLAQLIGAPTGARSHDTTAAAPSPTSAASTSKAVSVPKWSQQRETMREIYARWKHDPERIIREYAAAERAGRAERKSNKSGRTPEEYARALLADGLKKRWLE